jgi:hypothetical protein
MRTPRRRPEDAQERQKETNRTIILRTTKNVEDPAIQKELSGLSTYAISMYDKLAIYDDGPRDFISHYSNSASPSRFTMGSIWHDDLQKFTRHS